MNLKETCADPEIKIKDGVFHVFGVFFLVWQDVYMCVCVWGGGLMGECLQDSAQESTSESAVSNTTLTGSVIFGKHWG